MPVTSSVSFSSLDLGFTKPTSIPQDLITVEITSDSLIGDYAKAFVNEAFRVAPLRAEQVALTISEVEDYVNYLLTQRINVVRMDCPDFRKLKVLYVPSFIQYVLSMIGVVTDREKGIRIEPEMETPSSMSFDEALKISEKIGSFENDLQIVQDAIPRGIDGDKDVMSAAMIAGYVRSMHVVEHPAATYVTAFAGMKLQQEVAFAALYRVQYDDVEFIRSALLTQKGLFS